jgi:hypothetical protein
MPHSLEIAMKTIKIGGKIFGCVPCVVELGGSHIDGFAAIHEDERWISSREDITRWLMDRGLTENEAMLLIELGIAHDAKIPSLVTQEVAGGYYEEAGKIVDGIEEDIKNRFLTNVSDAYTNLRQHCEESKYATEPSLAAVTLQYSKHPTAYFESNAGVFITRTNWKRGRVTFPFAAMAKDAMTEDCFDMLRQRDGYRHLTAIPN